VRPGARRLAATALLALLGGGAPGSAQPAPAHTEYDVKAAFLYNFTKFVKWPSAKAQGVTFVVAVLGDDPFGDALDRTFDGKMVLDRKVEIRRLSRVESPATIGLLFVASSEEARLPQALKALEGHGVLTVGEMDRFTERGGMIGLRLAGDLVKFDINLAAVEDAGLEMSSQLIRLARHVIPRRGAS
jgi:hypothetical protein